MADVAYYDQYGYPHAADGSVILTITKYHAIDSGNAGELYIPNITVTGVPIPRLNSGSAAGGGAPQTIGAGIAGLFASAAAKTGLPQWLIVAATAAAMFYALQEMDFGGAHA